MDCDGAYDLKQGTMVFVNSGTVNAGLFYECTAADPITIGTTALTWAVVSPSAPIILPLAVAQGGTGSSTAPTARTALGVAPVGARVLMTYTAGAWVVIAPDGSLVSTVGTTTSGLQEAINYAQTNGYPLEVMGPGATAAGTNPALIVCTTGVTIGPIAQLGFFVRNAIINWGAAFAGVGLTINSCDTAKVDIDAVLLYQGSGDAVVLFKPTSNYPVNPQTLIQGSKFRFKEILAAGGTVSKLVRFDTTAGGGGTNGSISNTMFDLGYLLGGGFASYGIYIDNPPAGKAFNNNQISFGLIVSCSTASIQLGTSAPAGVLATNWFKGSIETSGVSLDGVKCYGFLNTFDVNISVDTGTLARGYNFAVGSAVDNVVLAKQIVATAIVVDSGARNYFYMMEQANFHAHKTADQVGILTATETKVVWEVVDWDPHNSGQGAFSLANNWYVAPFRGIMEINAKVRVTANWLVGGNNIDVAVNGIVIENVTVPGQAAQADTMHFQGHIKVLVGDQISIGVNLVGAGNKTIGGAGFNAYCTFSGAYVGTA